MNSAFGLIQLLALSGGLHLIIRGFAASTVINTQQLYVRQGGMDEGGGVNENTTINQPRHNNPPQPQQSTSMLHYYFKELIESIIMTEHVSASWLFS